MKIVEKKFDKELLNLYSKIKDKCNGEFTDLTIVNNVYLIFQKLIENKDIKGKYIFNIDADELPNKWLMKNIKSILEANPSIDLYWVPRVNTVKGLTQEHIDKWRWQVNEKGWVNFPDFQGRIWRNRPNIRWKNPVHEVLEGYKEHTYLPAEEEFCFYHPKDIDRQEKQNSFYETI